MVTIVIVTVITKPCCLWPFCVIECPSASSRKSAVSRQTEPEIGLEGGKILKNINGGSMGFEIEW